MESLVAFYSDQRAVINQAHWSSSDVLRLTRQWSTTMKERIPWRFRPSTEASSFINNSSHTNLADFLFETQPQPQADHCWLKRPLQGQEAQRRCIVRGGA